LLSVEKPILAFQCTVGFSTRCLYKIISKHTARFGQEVCLFTLCYASGIGPMQLITAQICPALIPS
jgi:hypothetical protein